MRPNRQPIVAGLALLVAGSIACASARADDLPGHPGAFATLAELDRYYERQFSALERRRLDDLAGLAARERGAGADAAYRACFQTALARGWFHEAAPAAVRCLAAQGTSADVRALAVLVAALDDVDQGREGRVDRALETLRAWLKDRPPPDAASALGTCEALVRRLVHAARYEPARQVCALLAEEAGPELAAHFKARLRQLELVGRPAPAIAADDVDGQPFRLADHRGKVVLIVFWATWCPPCLGALPRLNALEAKNKSRGLELVGVNVDAHHRDVLDVASVRPTVRHVLVEHGVGWTNVLNDEGDGDIAHAYGVETVPASVLVGRDGKVVGVELDDADIEAVVEKALGPAPGQ